MNLQLITIARNTFLECIRQPIFVVLILVASLALIFNPLLAAYTLDNDNKLLIDLGLSTLFLAGLLLAAFSATGVLATEIENKTVLTVVSKPVSRVIFILGKYVGVASAIGLAYWTLSIIFLLTVRQGVMQTATDQFDVAVMTFGIGGAALAALIAAAGNFFYRWVFTSTFILWLALLLTIAFGLVLVLGKPEPGSPFIFDFQNPMAEFHEDGHFPGGQMLIGLLLIFEAVLILIAIAITTSTRVGQVMTLTICTGLFVLGLISDFIYNKYNVDGVRLTTRMMAKIFYTVTPNMQILWPADALSAGNKIPAEYLGLVSCYSLLFIAGVLCLAVALFQTREIG